MLKTRGNLNPNIQKTFKLDSVKKKMIAGFMLLTLINITSFLAFQIYSSYGRLKEEALDKSYAYAEHIEKIISPIGIKQTEKLQSKITSLLSTQYSTAGYLGVLDKNLNYITNTDKSKIGTQLKTPETEAAIKTNKNVSFTIELNGKKEYISMVPLYNITMVKGVDGVTSATAKIDVPGYVVVSMNTEMMIIRQRTELIKILAIGCVLLALSIVIAVIISKNITNPLKSIRSHLHSMAEGDFTKSVSVKSKDELLTLANDLNKTNFVLKNMIADIKSTANTIDKYSHEVTHSTNNITGASDEISLSMDEVAGSTTEQASSLSDTVNTVNIFSKNLDNINLRIQGIEGNSIQIKDVADKGNIKINELLLTMKEVQSCFESVKNKIENLSSSVGQIHLITETINSVAKQTNLLSLNASIEAARAGDAGGGFIVVANEVRKLADQTLQASHSISELINDISDSTSIVADTTTEAITKVEIQSSTIQGTVTVFNRIVEQINVVIPQINEVASTLDQTMAMKDNILINVKSIASTSEEMAASAEEVSALTQEQSVSIFELSNLSEQLNKTSISMNESIDKFKIDNTLISKYN
ncbi:MAG TPA: methyl-accepting chemotaxis protein [Clostridium sp.]|uniref:methyl-accepting chemotaxis protein n=1 Tax=Clostridium sp. TaxID=1506 RepID=UPI002F930869